MPFIVKHRSPPASWRQTREKAPHRSLLPIYYANWLGEWAAYFLGKWSIFEVLEYLGSFSILIAVIFYFADAGDRLKQKHYQAWQVINTAQGKGGSGGRIEALRELNEDHIPLIGVDVSDAYLENLRLVSADLRRADLSSADLRHALFRKSNLEGANLRFANLRNADFSMANLTDANLRDADLTECRLTQANLHGVNLARADLRRADLEHIGDWHAIRSIRLANLHGVVSPPEGFISWAKANGAVDVADDAEWAKALDADPATRPAGGPERAK